MTENNEPKMNIVNGENKCKGPKGCNPYYYPVCTPYPDFYPDKTKYPHFESENANYPDFEAMQANYPDFIGEEATYPNFTGEDANYPNFTAEEATYPNFTGEDTNYPNFTAEEATYPNFTGEDANYPNFTAEEATYPNFTGEDTNYPNFTAEEATYPNFTGEDTNYPNFTAEEATYPNFTGEDANYPNFTPEEATYPNFTGEDTNYPNFTAEEATYPNFTEKQVEYIVPVFKEKIIEIPICQSCCDCCCDICEQQLKYVAAQLITIYAEDNWIINLDSGKTASGTPTSLVTSINQGLLYNESTGEYANICKTSSITITSTKYDASIQYLPAPVREPECGCAYSIYSIIKDAPASSLFNFNVGGQSTGNVPVIANHIGIVVIQRGENLEFIKTCAIESFTIS